MSTLARFEKGIDVMHSTVTRLREAFEARGIEFSGKTTVTYRPKEDG